MSSSGVSELRTWSADRDPIIANHRAVPVNETVAEGEFFTRLCFISVPECLSTPFDAVNAYEAETKRLLRVASIAVLEHEFILIKASDIDDSPEAGLTQFVARQNRVPASKQAGREPDAYLGAIVPKITVRRPNKNVRGIHSAVGAYYLDSALKPRNGFLIQDLKTEQISMRHRRDLKVPYTLFDLDVLLNTREA